MNAQANPGISAEMVAWIATFPRDIKRHPRFREVVDRNARDGATRDDRTRARIAGEVRAIEHMEGAGGR